MKATKLQPTTNPPKPQKLSTVNFGEVFRFAEVTYDEALNEDNQAFYMKVNLPDIKPTKINIMSIDGKTFLSRDEDRLVFVHPTELSISETPKQ